MFIAKALYATSPSNPPYAFDAVLPIIDLIVDSEYKKLKLFTTKFLSIKVPSWLYRAMDIKMYIIFLNKMYF